MATVTQWGLCGLLAAAEEYFLAGFGCVFDGFQPRALVRSIAERLASGPSAGTPEVAFSLGNFDNIGFIPGNLRLFRHLTFPVIVEFLTF